MATLAAFTLKNSTSSKTMETPTHYTTIGALPKAGIMTTTTIGIASASLKLNESKWLFRLYILMPEIF